MNLLGRTLRRLEDEKTIYITERGKEWEEDRLSVILDLLWFSDFINVEQLRLIKRQIYKRYGLNL